MLQTQDNNSWQRQKCECGELRIYLNSYLGLFGQVGLRKQAQIIFSQIFAAEQC
jgi:hypothetical protein